jgi:hypothetical protein
MKRHPAGITITLDPLEISLVGQLMQEARPGIAEEIKQNAAGSNFDRLRELLEIEQTIQALSAKILAALTTPQNGRADGQCDASAPGLNSSP